jgi:preprotein translocase subunit SecA
MHTNKEDETEKPVRQQQRPPLRVSHNLGNRQAPPPPPPPLPTDAPEKITIRRDMPKVGRNDNCPCGSGKKYKNCHGRNEQ